MELVRVKITGLVITNRYGTLSAGDILRTDAAFAKHLVEDCRAAEFIQDAIEKPTEQKKPNKKAKL